MSARPIIAVACVALVTACADPPPGSDRPPDPRPLAMQAERSVESFANEAFYAGVEKDLIARGQLRTDTAPRDALDTAATLARDFMALAFSQEFSDTGTRLIAKSTESTLHRWDTPVRLTLHFGPTVPTERRAQDKRAVDGLARTLAAATRHDIATATVGGNFHVLVLNDQELRRAGDQIRRLMPEVTNAVTAYVERMPRDTYCVVFASDPGEDRTYGTAIAVIRNELPPRLRTSCFHEEVAQGLGLANDSPRARPSIFNDNDEFGVLTRHDLDLLRILYDPRLSPDTAARDAADTVQLIAEELRPSG